MADKKDPWKESVFTPYAVIPSSSKNLYNAIPQYLKGRYNEIVADLKKPMTPTDVDNFSTEMAMNFGPMGLGTMIGKGARMFDVAASEKAAKLAKEGKSVQDIWETTGTRRWKSGDRQEINDMNAVFKPKYLDLPFASTKLGSMLEHPEIFKNYPELEKTRVVVREDLKPGEASFSSELNEINIARADVKNKNLSTLLHEVQHWIQNKEGWQSGANPLDFTTKTHTFSTGATRELSPLDQYLLSPGENEAVSTQARQFLTDKQRRARLPEKDFPTEVKFLYDFYK